MSVTLEWHGPYPLSAFPRRSELGIQFNVPGVYLWVEDLPNQVGKRLSYVGKASGKPTLYARQLQHYAYTVGGLYMIPREYRDERTKWAVDWKRPECVSVMLDEEQFIRVVRDGFRLAAATAVYLAPYRDGDLGVLEANLLYALQPTGTDRGTRYPPKTRLEVLHTGATLWICPDTRRQFKEESLVI